LINGGAPIELSSVSGNFAVGLTTDSSDDFAKGIVVGATTTYPGSSLLIQAKYEGDSNNIDKDWRGAARLVCNAVCHSGWEWKVLTKEVITSYFTATSLTKRVLALALPTVLLSHF